MRRTASISWCWSALRQGHDVQTFYDGRSAIEAAEAAVPEVMLLDLGMPEMDGFQVLRALRQDTRTSNVPVVINTSMALTQLQIDELKSQAAAIVSKEQFAHGEGLERLRRIVVENMAPASAT